ncbi:uncharacterized protein FOBCDRAFT_200905 [Fusarium oxysporum Fo47]|uniref:uncharacterized protein n=1 Tax=Fusarium oxysporum Fo47 TaxID=660027 RepID=UPI002869D6F0|nr:uncharacterized protein FOBCDRAFT_200905 [Fusarium oxysporum Fo47]QKD53659.2 hypothetical protein FOBCDRAFT_200905 [Fusarium oxysporum Fo47]
MSGLEPLAALGFVCNIVQSVEVGLKTATLCKNAYCTGEPDPELSIYAPEPRRHRFNCPMQNKEHAIGCLQQDPNWSRKTVPGDWDSEDLQYLFSSYLSQAARPFCLFIDGIDELMGDSGMGILINLFNSLQISSRLVKVCMLSRPEQAIRTRQSREPDLKMQDLTRVDIERCINCPGIMNGDSEIEIQERILRTPKDLYNLYLNMWTRLGEDSDLYQGSTALTFKVDQRCNELYTRLPIRRADLFEVIYITPPERPGLSRVANKARFPILEYDNLKVQAIHLTVLDFLIETEGGNKIMEHHKASREELFLRIFRSCLLRDCLWPEFSFNLDAYLPEARYQQRY